MAGGAVCPDGGLHARCSTGVAEPQHGAAAPLAEIPERCHGPASSMLWFVGWLLKKLFRFISYSHSEWYEAFFPNNLCYGRISPARNCTMIIILIIIISRPLCFFLFSA